MRFRNPPSRKVTEGQDKFGMTNTTSCFARTIEMKLTKSKIMSKLNEVLDPELNISIVDLGLIYGIEITKQHLRGEPLVQPRVKILMTLTTIGCPLISIIEGDIKNKLMELGLKEKDIKLELTFDPPWSMDKMSERAKAMLGIT